MLDGVTITEPVLHQAGVIAYRLLQGKIEVLLVTSRETKRWIIPKGNINAGSTPAQAAKREAYEEAGVKGEIAGSLPLGTYTYFKRLAGGKVRAAAVEVYLLQLEEQLKRWPERHERKVAWVSTAEAIRIVEEPGVLPLLQRLTELEDSLVHSWEESLSELRADRSS